MLALLIIVAALTAVGALVLLGIERGRHFSDVDRFHRASAMTTEWARQGVTTPVFAEEHPAEDGEDSRPNGRT